jgi:hypothetical protein
VQHRQDARRFNPEENGNAVLVIVVAHVESTMTLLDED